MKFFKYISGILVVLILALNGLSAQQIGNSSHLPETRIAWNPAVTAFDNFGVFDAFFRMQWLGFSGAPVTGFVSAQYPLVRQNMSVGGVLHFDQTGPVSKFGVQLNYAYKLKEVLGRHDQLSLGISANFQQYVFNASGLISNEANDPLLQAQRHSSFFSSAGLGFFYNSNQRAYRGNSFFTGFSINQGLTTKVLVNESDQRRERHFHFTAGGNIYGYNGFVQPAITANMVSPDIIDILYSLKYEMKDSFWAGAGYASSGMMTIQGGVIMNEFGSRNSDLRLGVLANYGISSGLSRLGPGFEFYIGYNFKT
jgi:type IX secretion system PorP/SprF family membrane protein